MLPLEKRVNLSLNFLPFSYKIVIPKIIKEELEKLKKSAKPSTKKKANFAFKLAENYENMNSSIGVHPDDEILRLALEHNAIVATTDRELKRKLRENGIAIISLRGKNKLEIVGDISPKLL